LIDVAASANGRRPDFAVLRVVFEERVALPDVVGSDADTAQEQLEGLGLTVELENGGGFFDPILPGDPKVCELQPEPGTQVLPGSEVTVLVARDC
jgi:beta-lactam-binding protein with PASTA domain